VTGHRLDSTSTAAGTRTRTRPTLDTGTGTPNPARIYDWLLGGKDHFPADRAAAEEILAAVPQAAEAARENRAFLGRAVRFLAGEAGIGQFLDIGTGLPTQANVHQVAQAVAPGARVVYVDNDPIVLVHARALLANNTTTTTAVQADLRDPDQLLGDPSVGKLLDFGQPLGLLLVAVLHFLTDHDDPAGIVARLRDGMAPGSFVVISHATADFHPEAAAARVTAVYERASAPLALRSRDQIARLFDGFELVSPGLVQPAAWRPDPDPDLDDNAGGAGAGGFHAGVGRRL